MTETTTTVSTSTDPRPAFGSAVATAVAVATVVRPEQLSCPTPCPEFDVRALLGHQVFVLRRVAAIGRGEDPFSVPELPAGVPDDGWGAAARAAAAEVLTVWADDELLDRELTLPFGSHRGSVALAAYTSELTTHSWDLARATGQSPDWDERVLAVALPAAQRILPADVRGGPVPFGPVVPVPDDAPLVDRLVAWQGRDPRWTP
ncbi:TIGR03086 family metal-binding protein [Modestobacter sp. I12A-02662]|uniref:TIGR03086 family metal-binding protein n=1 Tax=Modestobacter sp. I12A-02662 TaxID=1730496 RepID=UPI0034DE3C08